MENNNFKDLYLLPDEHLNPGRLFMFMYNEVYSVYKFKGKHDIPMLISELTTGFPNAKELYCYEDEQIEENANEVNVLKDFPESYNLSYIFELEKMVILEINNHYLILYYKKSINISKYQELIRKCVKKTEKKFKFNLIVNSPYGDSSLDVEEFDIKRQEININENYNDDFSQVNDRIVNFLNEDKNSGLVILHGKHGTGKTSYIRYLISNVNKKFIYLPSYLVNEISSPRFIPFIKDYKECILIIEDCEEIIKSRELGNTSSAIANLLNLGDGLLSDALFLKVICTFNTDLKNIDRSLLRKGRLKGRYEFKELAVDKVKHFYIKNNITDLEPAPMTLAELYNLTDNTDDDFSEIKKIGFGVNN